MSRILLLLALCLLTACTPAAPPRKPPPPPPRERPPAEVQARVTDLSGAYGGDVGVAVLDVEDGWLASYNGQRFFPQQSVSKIWVAMAVLDAVDHGEMSLETPVFVRPSDLSLFFQPIAKDVGERGYETTVGDLLRRAITQSDNAADDVLMDRVGGAQAVENMLARKRLVGIRIGDDQKHLQSRIAGLTWNEAYIGTAFRTARERLPSGVRDANLAAYLAEPPDGATPVGVVRALGALAHGQALSPRSTATLLTVMGGAQTGPRRLKGGLDPDWFIAHKTGTGPDWRGASVGINDVAIVTAPDGHRYAIAVFIAQTAAPIPQRQAFMQGVARTVVDYWNRRHPDLAGSPLRLDLGAVSREPSTSTEGAF